VVIYGHGNSSDMGDSLHFISRMAERFRAEYVVFDYTGYGASKKKEVGEEVIVKDLSIVLSWLACPLDRVVLWGFSLGTYPAVVNSARFKVAGTILQCPIGSLSCMFYD
jgi:abhydrolase domain-containing protein 17